MLLSLTSISPPVSFWFSQAGTRSTFNKVGRKINFGWTRTDRAGYKPFSQATKAPVESISIAGNYSPLYNLQSTPELLKRLGEVQSPIDVTDGTGTNWGQFVIVSLNIGQQLFIDGGIPLVVDFSMELEEYVP